MKLAMSVGHNRHYRVDAIVGRHFLQTGAAAGMSQGAVTRIFEELRERADTALARVESTLPPRFPEAIHASVDNAVKARLRRRAQVRAR